MLSVCYTDRKGTIKYIECDQIDYNNNYYLICYSVNRRFGFSVDNEQDRCRQMVAVIPHSMVCDILPSEIRNDHNG